MYSSSLENSRTYRDPVAKIENGGLFSKERCREITQ